MIDGICNSLARVDNSYIFVNGSPRHSCEKQVVLWIYRKLMTNLLNYQSGVVLMFPSMCFYCLCFYSFGGRESDGQKVPCLALWCHLEEKRKPIRAQCLQIWLQSKMNRWVTHYICVPIYSKENFDLISIISSVCFSQWQLSCFKRVIYFN